MTSRAQSSINAVRQTVVKYAALPVLGFALMPANSALAAGTKKEVSLKFDVYSANLLVFKISLHMSMDDTDYVASTSIKSKGLASLFAKTKIGMSTRGKIKAGKVVPAAYSLRTKSKGRKRKIQLSWNAKRYPTTKRSYNLSKFKSNQLKLTVRAGMNDPLSHIMKVVLQTAKKPCTGLEYVYDGQVVGEYRYSYKGISTFTQNTGGVYRGKAIKCRLNYKAIAGLSIKKQKAQKAEPPVFTIWYAPVSGKKRKLLIPIAASGKSAGRSFTMRLSKGTVSGRSIASRSVATN